MHLLDIKRKKGTLNTIHFVGIGGIGMSGIAEIMHNMEYNVQGSDINENSNTKRLVEKGIKVYKGHDAINIKDASYLIISTAIKQDNLEIIAAKKLHIPIISRAEMLAELMRLKCSVAVSGSHGKTTTTSLVACLFEAAGLDPTVINGGVINNRLTNAYLGKGEYLIVEADESDATFLKLPSTIGVITNIDPEHMDFYKDYDSLLKAFKSFILNLPFYGFAVLCIDHPEVRRIAETTNERKIITYGIDSQDANIIAYDIKSDTYNSKFNVKIRLQGELDTVIINNISIPTPGKHNVLNALAAIAIGVELDFGVNVIRDGFTKFEGVKRRFTKICEYKGAELVDDYAHHPVEIEATLSTAKSITEPRGGKIIAIFQPHRYTRLRDLFEEFSNCFSDANEVYIADVFAAGEDPIDGAKTIDLVENLISKDINAKYLDNHEDITKIAKTSKSGDIILFMGAGNITNWANELPKKLLDNSSINYVN